MEFKSIINKSIFIVTLILAVICWINNSIIESFVSVCVIPIFLINILLIVNSINNIIIEKTSNNSSFYKQFENDETIAQNEKEENIKREIIYYEISNLFEIRINRIISWIMIFVLIAFFILVIFNQNVYKIIADFRYNSISILSCTSLMIDTFYKEKIADKIIAIIYKIKIKKEDKNYV